MTASLRYNRNTETLNGYSVNTDVGDVGSGFDEARPLFGDHTYSRLNPAFGFTLTPTPALTLYADYNEASRAPTVIELGCSNPAAPCGLPNDFASDPDLKQVVARTVEIGARGGSEDKKLNWSVDVFHTVNSDDIQFVATNTNQGYFDNVGSTRRQGVDLSVGGKVADLSWRVVYSFVEATFESNFELNGESNSTADENGNIQVRAGDRLPLIPRHTGRLVLDYAPNERWDLGANLIAASGIFLHGNENNANQAGGTNGEGALIAGSGWISGYAVLNLHGTYRIGKSTDAFIRVVNVFNKDYATAGFLTATFSPSNGSFPCQIPRIGPMRTRCPPRSRVPPGWGYDPAGNIARWAMLERLEAGVNYDDAPLRLFHLRVAVASCGGVFSDGYSLAHHRHFAQPCPAATWPESGVAGIARRRLPVRTVCRSPAHRPRGRPLRTPAHLCVQHGPPRRPVAVARPGGNGTAAAAAAPGDRLSARHGLCREQGAVDRVHAAARARANSRTAVRGLRPAGMPAPTLSGCSTQHPGSRRLAVDAAHQCAALSPGAAA